MLGLRNERNAATRRGAARRLITSIQALITCRCRYLPKALPPGLTSRGPAGHSVIVQQEPTPAAATAAAGLPSGMAALRFSQRIHRS
jgi:hypothetical protein